MLSREEAKKTDVERINGLGKCIPWLRTALVGDRGKIYHAVILMLKDDMSLKQLTNFLSGDFYEHQSSASHKTVGLPRNIRYLAFLEIYSDPYEAGTRDGGYSRRHPGHVKTDRCL